jgi:hypothetical protein
VSSETPTTINIDVPPRKIWFGRSSPAVMKYGKTAIAARKDRPEERDLVSTVFK